MFSYFINNPDSDITYPTKKYFKWEVIRKMYCSELEKVKNYYRNREYNYDNANPLIRIIKTLSRDHRLDVFDYLSYVDTDVDYIATQFNFVNNRSQGMVHDNVLYESNSREIFLCVDNSVDPIWMENNWKEYESIRVIKTDATDIYYPVLFRKDRVMGSITVFEIDIKAMLLQYYYWCKERVVGDRDISANIFLPTVVIPNISNSLIDYAIWNRFKAIALGAEIEEDSSKHPISLIDYTKGIDDVLYKVVKDNANTSIYVTQLLRTIPTMTNDDMYSVLQMHKSFYNKQSRWVLWLSRLSEIADIHMIIGKKGYRLNRSLYNAVPYELKLISRRESMLEDKLNVYEYISFNEKNRYLNEQLGKR